MNTNDFKGITVVLFNVSYGVKMLHRLSGFSINCHVWLETV